MMVVDPLFANLDWQPPSDWLRITTIDMHTGGEPLRVITGGLPPVPGDSVLEKRRYFSEHLDHLRTALMWEPRGHADMYGAVVSSSRDADFDVFFLHNEGYSTMCGHAVIALTRLMLETGLVSRPGDQPELIINVPCGQVRASARRHEGRIVDIRFVNVPSFVYLRDGEVEVPGIGNMRFDIAYGGAFYAFVDADALGIEMTPQHFDKLVDHGRRIKRAVMDKYPITHPFENDLSFLYGTIFTGRPQDPRHHSRNVCVFAEGEVDRSATGSGVSARAALHYAKGELDIGEEMVIESITGSTMSVSVVETCTYGPHDAVIPRVGGDACITGRHEFLIDPEDPFRDGFIFR